MFTLISFSLKIFCRKKRNRINLKLKVAEMPALEGRHVPRISRLIKSSKSLHVYIYDKRLTESINFSLSPN